MSLVTEHNKLRPQPPRLKNVGKRTREPDRNRDARGHFTKGNDAPKGRRLKQIIRAQLGADSTNEQVERIFGQTRDVFRACCRAIGSDVPQVQDLLARRARWSVLSAHYALRAAEVGLETDAGRGLIDLALKLCQRAERLDVTALDLALRLDSRRPEQANPILAAIEAAGSPATEPGGEQ